MSHTQVAMDLVKGKIAPRYPMETPELSIDRVVITEQGTEGNLPIVDFQMSDRKGNKYFAAITGRIVLTVASALRGVNMRIHGTEEP